MNVFVDLCIVFHTNRRYIREYYIVYTPKNVKKIALISELIYGIYNIMYKYSLLFFFNVVIPYYLVRYLFI